MTKIKIYLKHTLSKSSPPGHKGKSTVEFRIPVRQADGQRARLVCRKWLEEPQQSYIVLLRLNVKVWMHDGLNSAFDPPFIGAGEINATHADEQVLCRYTEIDEINKNRRYLSTIA